MASIKLKGTITNLSRTEQIDLTIEIPDKVIGGYLAAMTRIGRPGGGRIMQPEEITKWLSGEESEYADGETT